MLANLTHISASFDYCNFSTCLSKSGPLNGTYYKIEKRPYKSLNPFGPIGVPVTHHRLIAGILLAINPIFVYPNPTIYASSYTTRCQIIWVKGLSEMGYFLPPRKEYLSVMSDL